jgi:hypothetical protein
MVRMRSPVRSGDSMLFVRVIELLLWRPSPRFMELGLGRPSWQADKDIQVTLLLQQVLEPGAVDQLVSFSKCLSRGPSINSMRPWRAANFQLSLPYQEVVTMTPLAARLSSMTPPSARTDSVLTTPV